MKIAVTGGKGGTGKTVIAVNLAVCLAKLGKKVAYLDCDADCPSSHLIVGASLQKKEKVSSFFPIIDKNKCRKCGMCVQNCEFNALYQLKGKPPELVQSLCSGCGACMIACPYGAIKEGKKTIGWTFSFRKYGVHFFSGKLKPSEPLTEKIVDAVKKRGMQGKYDIIIVDTAAGAHCQVVSALEGCDKAFAVTEPTLFGRHDLKVISKVLEKMKIQYEIILNRSTISKTRVKSVLQIPYDRKMIECYVLAVPIVEKYPNHPISRKIAALAKRLLK